MLKKKDSILILFSERKKETPNTFFFEKKFSLEYETKLIYLTDFYHKSNFSIVKHINEIIQKENITVVLFQGDGLSVIDTNFINLINNKVKKGLLTWDDKMYHYTNRITASACDFVLSGCPLSVIKFLELGYKAFFLPVETNGSIFKDLKEKKIYDVLFFGRQKNNRAEVINYLKDNNIKVFQCGPYDEISNTFEKLNTIMNQSKIVINFTQQDNTKYKYNQLSYFKFHFDIKGRSYFTGLSGTLCISEYNPSAELIFKNNELPIFRSKEECLKIIKDFLSDNTKLEEATNKYKKKCLEFEDTVYMKKTKKFIDDIHENSKDIKIQIPFWYEYIYFKKTNLIRFKKNIFFTFFIQAYETLFINRYKNKGILPIIFLLTLFSSMLFLLKFPFSNKNYEKI